MFNKAVFIIFSLNVPIAFNFLKITSPFSLITTIFLVFNKKKNEKDTMSLHSLKDKFKYKQYDF